MMPHQNRSVSGMLHGHGQGRVEGTTGSSSPTQQVPLWGQVRSMWEVKWGWKCSLPSGLIRKGAGLSCITSELALHSSSLTRRREDESRALTFTPVLPVLWKTKGLGSSPTAAGGATTLPKKKVKNCDLLSVSRKLYSTYFSPIIIPKYFSAHAYLLASLCLLVFTMNF